ncbi:MAG: alpha-2-macroglobulin family protein, partial [Candidatus Eremiobacterota bacterium]
ANSLKDGSALPGVDLRLVPGPSATTGPDGTARFELAPKSSQVLVARLGDDLAMLPRSIHYWDESGWAARARTDALRWYVFDDRGMYRPGEEVRIKGWLRVVQAGPRGDIAGVGSGTVAYQVRDSRGNEILKGEAQLSPAGGFDFSLKLPRTVNLGSTNVYLSATTPGLSGSSSHAFQVEEFRRPEFEVSASASPDTAVVGESATASVQASYYAGGGLPNAPVEWNVTATPGSYSPPGREDYGFGTWTPWWEEWDYRGYPYQTPGVSKDFTGRTDGSGAHHLRLQFQAVDPPRPTVVEASASVMDVNRQAWGASASVLVHPAQAYVGIKTAKAFVEKGQPIEVETLVCDPQGKALTGRPIAIRAVRLDYHYAKGRYEQVEADPQEFAATSGSEPSRFRFRTPEGGTYRIAVRTRDEKDRPNESTLTVWVSGGKAVPERKVEQERVTLIPDRQDYRPGDTARVLVQAPFYPAEGLMTLRRSGFLATERFSLSGPSTVLKVPIESAHIPNLHLQVDLVGAQLRDPQGSAKRPAYASGQLNLPVPPYERTLKVQVQPARPAMEPGGETTLGVRVLDAQGKPVSGAEVAVVVVDEAVLALTGYRVPDPVAVFYAGREAGAYDHHSRESVLLVDLSQLQEDPATADGAQGTFDTTLREGAGGLVSAQEAPGAAGEDRRRKTESKAGKDAGLPVQVRQNFDALALFAPRVSTDASGSVSLKLKLPDNLTRYRIMAVAVAGSNHCGQGESSLTARLPLMLRPSPPRFLNFGDRCELPVVVQNQTDKPAEVQVVVRAVNASLTEGNGRVFHVPANDRAEVRFPVSAESAGTASFQVGAFSGEAADAAEFKFPVWTPATTEAFATYGVVDEGAVAQPVQAPKDVWPQFGGLELTTSSTALQELTDAVLYLVSYPYECAEQVSSRVLAVAALRDVLTAFRTAELPDPASLNAAVQRDLERLKGMQRHDGAFGYWTAYSEDEWPYLSVHVAHTLVRAKAKGYEVPSTMLDRSLNYLKDVERHIPSWYGDHARRTIVAYALFVRNLAGDRDVARARKLVQQAGGVKGLPLEALGWILPVLSGQAPEEVAAIRRHLDNRVTETAGAAHFAENYGEQGPYLLMSSDRRVDAILLEALIVDQPESDLIPKLVRGLLNHRKQGRWYNTQENVFVLLALDRYFNTYEKLTPDFVVRVWLGDEYAGQQKFQGRSPDRKAMTVPMASMAGRGRQDLILGKQGQGRLYYRIGMNYAPKSLQLEAADHGFVVQRSYEAVEDPGDVARDAQGVWQVKAGKMVRVRITMVAPTRRYHVALVDPLPAGLEAMNPALAVTGKVPADPKQREGAGRYWYWLGTWYEHQNLRDERAEAFTSLLWEGVYTYTYVCRATTPGEFVVPPSKAEEMYSPETFGRGAADRMVVR